MEALESGHVDATTAAPHAAHVHSPCSHHIGDYWLPLVANFLQDIINGAAVPHGEYSSRPAIHLKIGRNRMGDEKKLVFAPAIHSFTASCAVCTAGPSRSIQQRGHPHRRTRKGAALR